MASCVGGNRIPCGRPLIRARMFCTLYSAELPGCCKWARSACGYMHLLLGAAIPGRGGAKALNKRPAGR